MHHHGFVFWTWLGHFFGVSDESGPGYGFFSGVGSDIGEIALLGAVIGLFRAHNCHTTGCWHIARHQVGPYKVCRRCAHAAGVVPHPKTVTLEHIAEAHQKGTPDA